MKFFVSGKVGQEKNVKVVMDRLIKNGHEITFDWTRIDHLRPYDQNSSYSKRAAIKESEGVKNADVLVVLAHDNGVGMYVELGIAIGLNKQIRVVTSRRSRSMFFYHPLVKKVNHISEVVDEFSNKKS